MDHAGNEGYYGSPGRRFVMLTHTCQKYCTRRHVLFRELGIKRSRNASPVLMVVPTDWTKEEHERITQIFFENFNVPGLYLAEEPLMILYGCATVTGLIIDIGHNSTGKHS